MNAKYLYNFIVHIIILFLIHIKMSKSSTLPIELINIILSFRPQHPTAALIKQACDEFSRKISNYLVFIRILKVRKSKPSLIDIQAQKCFKLVRLRDYIVNHHYRY